MEKGSTLLTEFLNLVGGWAAAFPQARSANRAIEQALAGLLALGRRTLSRNIQKLGPPEKPDKKRRMRGTAEAANVTLLKRCRKHWIRSAFCSSRSLAG
jgi:hypothetical protein